MKQTTKKMEILKGIGVSPGIAISPAVILEAEDLQIQKRFISPDDARAEVKRLRQGFLDAIEEVAGLQGAQNDIWDANIKDIFAVHLHFLRDRSLRRKIADLITHQYYNAEYAVNCILRDIAKHFSQAQDAYISERVNDIYDIEKRLLQHLIGNRQQDFAHLTEPAVVVAHDLMPSQTASFDHRFVKGILIDTGGRTSHTAIVARSLGIPAVVGLGSVMSSVSAGDLMIVDGNHGTVIIDPDEDTIAEYKAIASKFVAHGHALDALAMLPAVTTDGEDIQLMGNIEFPAEMDIIIQKGGHGVGLYRTEFLYLNSGHEPTEDEHYQAYLSVLKKADGRPVTLRTMDLGADKFTQYSHAVVEANPFLGLRSIRYCLQHLEMFKAQIRAVLRASVHGQLKIMFPLITDLIELRQAKWILADVKEDLEEEGILYDDHIQIGVMIETPAAVLIADHLAKEVDFFSIGTNDLVQYTLAVDRGNENVASLYTPSHPAVLQLIQQVTQVANRANIDISLCGEMASEIEYTPLLLGLGLKTLSLAPPMIPEVKKMIRLLSYRDCQAIARRARSFETGKQTINYLREEVRKVLGEEL